MRQDTACKYEWNRDWCTQSLRLEVVCVFCSESLGSSISPFSSFLAPNRLPSSVFQMNTLAGTKLWRSVLTWKDCFSSKENCAEEHRVWSYRSKLLETELLTRNAEIGKYFILSPYLSNDDVGCLQEVDHYDDFVGPLLKNNGYKSLWAKRGRTDGLVIYWREKGYYLFC